MAVGPVAVAGKVAIFDWLKKYGGGVYESASTGVKKAAFLIPLWAMYGVHTAGGFAGDFVSRYLSFLRMSTPDGDVPLIDLVFEPGYALSGAIIDGASWTVDKLYHNGLGRRKSRIEATTNPLRARWKDEIEGQNGLNSRRDPSDISQVLPPAYFAEVARAQQRYERRMADLQLRRQEFPGVRRTDYITWDDYDREAERVHDLFDTERAAADAAYAPHRTRYQAEKTTIDRRYEEAIRNAEIGEPYPRGYMPLKYIIETPMLVNTILTGYEAVSEGISLAFEGKPSGQGFVADNSYYAAGWLGVLSKSLLTLMMFLSHKISSTEAGGLYRRLLR